MDVSTREDPALGHLLVQSRVFEVVVGSGALAGPLHDLAFRFGVEPEDFLRCLDGLVSANWVTIKVEPESVLRIELET